MQNWQNKREKKKRSEKILIEYLYCRVNISLGLEKLLNGLHYQLIVLGCVLNPLILTGNKGSFRSAIRVDSCLEGVDLILYQLGDVTVFLIR